MRAAIELATELGLHVDDPVLVQETNNTVVWLRPHAVIAKVGTHADSADRLILEHKVASALTAIGAPVVPPLANVQPSRDPDTGFMVTLWSRQDHDANVAIEANDVGRSLLQVHAGLAQSDVSLPSFRDGLRRAQGALWDDSRIAALATDDRVFLRTAFADLLIRLDGHAFPEQGLHGDPASGNYLMTPSGLRWIDFESACRGPLEWDLAFLSDDARAAFTDVDAQLLELLITLKSAFIATWCWVQARFPEMRNHGQRHLDLVRTRWS
jgi:aminoglycoside phosphotransferase (APT) family kinase protein